MDHKKDQFINIINRKDQTEQSLFLNSVSKDTEWAGVRLAVTDQVIGQLL